MTKTRAAVVLGISVWIAAACGGGSGESTSTTTGNGTPPAVDPAECGLEELAAAEQPVEITFWHTMARTNKDWLEAVVEDFNATQSTVHVKLIDIPSYPEALTKYRAGLSSGDLPDLVQLEETAVQVMLDSQSTVPLQACVDAVDFDVSKFLPRALAYYSDGDVLAAMPWAISNPVLIYDTAKFEAAGLDPTKPPRTLAEVREYAQQIVDSGAADHGIALRVEPYVFEFLLAKSGGLYVNNGNGQSERATAAAFAGEEGTAIWEWWNAMVDDGLALNAGGQPNNFDHMLAVGTGDAAMAFEASGVLGIVRSVLESGQYPGVKIATAPLPALAEGGGVPVGDGALWIPNASDPAERGAAWTFVEYLSSAEQQAALAVAGGYAPVREDATAQAALVAKWEQEPIFRAGYDQLVSGPSSEATVGSRVGDYQGVRDAVKAGLSAMLEGTDPKTAIDDAESRATDAIEAYNESLGVG